MAVVAEPAMEEMVVCGTVTYASAAQLPKVCSRGVERVTQADAAPQRHHTEAVISSLNASMALCFPCLSRWRLGLG